MESFALKQSIRKALRDRYNGLTRLQLINLFNHLPVQYVLDALAALKAKGDIDDTQGRYYLVDSHEE